MNPKTPAPVPDAVLCGIRSPEDLEGLSPEALAVLAAECREAILQTVSVNGGHLASNLGAVELTIALHAVFHGPHDRMVWDVGHQAYTHKLLTGRRERFCTLRRKDGLSGFPKRAESPHDPFDTGHSGTSISAALGLARGLRDRGEKGQTIAVIGDGSMTSGMAWEGLNHAGETRERLLVVLNDNEMSIAPNVGALSSYLSRHLTGDFVLKVKKDAQAILRRFPNVLEGAKRAEAAVKSLVYPGMVFEEMGFEYIGPVDGHRFPALLEAFRHAQKLEKPVLVHVRTVKGKGYPPAEKDPASFHGVGPFDRATGRPLSSGGAVSWTRAFSDALLEAARLDPRVVAITAAMPEGTGLDRFARAYPDRFHDVGIAEQHAVTFAAGLAARGFRPVVAIYSTFLQRAYDQVVHDVCLQGLPVLFALDRAGLVGEDGPTHHGAFDVSFLRHIPDLTLMAPRDEQEIGSALATALTLPGPSAVRYPRGAGTGAAPRQAAIWEAGKGEVLRTGKDAAILAAGHTSAPALAAAELLAKDGLSVTVADPRFLKPLDESLTLALAAEHPLLVTVEENALAGGFGSAVLELLSSRGRTARVVRLGLPDRFVEAATQAELRASLGLDAEGIRRAVAAALKG